LTGTWIEIGPLEYHLGASIGISQTGSTLSFDVHYPDAPTKLNATITTRNDIVTDEGSAIFVPNSCDIITRTSCTGTTV
jgi:hypothetical protein